MATQKPDLTRVWANGAPPANVVDPDTTTPGKVNAGWQAEVPPFEHFNFLQKWFTQGLAHANEQGIMVWDTDTVYPIDGMAKGANGQIYVAIVEQSGNDPVSDNGTNWQLLATKLQVLSTGSTTPRSLGDRFAEVVNVKDFGATGDGVTNDEPAIRAAVLSLLSSGGTVFLPAGNYKIDGNFYIPAGVTFTGEGDKSVLLGFNASNTYTLSASPLSRVERIALDGTNAQGWGLQVDRGCVIKDVKIYQYKGTTETEDGTGLLLEGAFSSYFYDVRVTNCRQGCVVGKLGTSLENNANGFYNCGFEFTENPGMIINKCNVLSIFSCYFGHHGGIDGGDINGTAIAIQNTDASVIMDGVYTEFCTIGILNEGKTLDVKNGRFSNEIRVNSGRVSVSFCEFYGFGAYVDCPNGSTGFAHLFSNWSDGSAPIIGPTNFEDRITSISLAAGELQIRNGLNVYNGNNLQVRDGGNITCQLGEIRCNGAGGFVATAGNYRADNGDFVITNNSFGVILKAPNNTSYRVTVDNSGNIVTTLV